MTHEFMLMSGGTESAVLRDASPSCTCSDLSLSVVGAGGERDYRIGDPVAVGETLLARLSIDTAGLRGQVDSYARLTLEGSRKPITLRVQATVVQPFRSMPSTVAWGSFWNRAGASQQVVVTSDVYERFELLPPKSQSDVQFDVQPFAPDADGMAKSWRVIAAVLPSEHLGVMKREVRLTTRVREEGSSTEGTSARVVDGPDVALTLHGLAAGDLLAAPSTVSFGLLVRGQAAESSTTVRVMNPDLVARDFLARILSVSPESARESVQVQLSEVAGTPGQLDLVLQFAGGGDFEDSRFLRGVVEVFGDGDAKHAPSLQVPFVGVVPRQ